MAGSLYPLSAGAPPVTAGSPPSLGRSWPIASWVNYVQSRNALRNCIDWSHTLLFIVRGDVFPCAEASLSHLGIALANHGARARQPACYRVIGMAVCGDKDMAQLGAIWKDNPQVWFARTRSYFVSLSSRSNLNIQISKNVQERADVPKFCFLNFKKRFLNIQKSYLFSDFAVTVTVTVTVTVQIRHAWARGDPCTSA